MELCAFQLYLLRDIHFKHLFHFLLLFRIEWKYDLMAIQCSKRMFGWHLVKLRSNFALWMSQNILEIDLKTFTLFCSMTFSPSLGDFMRWLLFEENTDNLVSFHESTTIISFNFLLLSYYFFRISQFVRIRSFKIIIILCFCQEETNYNLWNFVLSDLSAAGNVYQQQFCFFVSNSYRLSLWVRFQVEYL